MVRCVAVAVVVCGHVHGAVWPWCGVWTWTCYAMPCECVAVLCCACAGWPPALLQLPHTQSVCPLADPAHSIGAVCVCPPALRRLARPAHSGGAVCAACVYPLQLVPHPRGGEGPGAPLPHHAGPARAHPTADGGRALQGGGGVGGTLQGVCVVEIDPPPQVLDDSDDESDAPPHTHPTHPLRSWMTAMTSRMLGVTTMMLQRRRTRLRLPREEGGQLLSAAAARSGATLRTW